jgi:hypothetical protein
MTESKSRVNLTPQHLRYHGFPQGLSAKLGKEVRMAVPSENVRQIMAPGQVNHWTCQPPAGRLQKADIIPEVGF